MPKPCLFIKGQILFIYFYILLLSDFYLVCLLKRLTSQIAKNNTGDEMTG